MNNTHIYLDFLTEQGFAPKMNNDDIIFKFEGQTYIISIDSNDDNYFRLILPNFWEVENDKDMNHALRVCNEVNSSIKGANTIIVNNNVWATAECFTENNPNPNDFFIRTLRTVKDASKRYTKKMLGEKVSLFEKIFQN
jgi:hypothetical protein